MQKNNNLLKDRAFLEINLNNLEHNINQIKQILSSKTKIMAVIKANAYGHDSILIAKKLSELGIDDFAVATLEEGIILRKNHIKGNILILGYTDFENLQYVIKYDLIQTIIDVDYSEKIKTLPLKNKLKCHVKINTGMNRIGEDCHNLSSLITIFENPKLTILGTFSHLCVADSKKKEDINFTKNQIQNFTMCIKSLQEHGFHPGKLHIQNSYGVINYNEEIYDYVRVGILMYGVNNEEKSYQKIKLDLKPVLSLKAKIVSIKEINKNESVGYGRTYIASSKRKIATIAIGYADGLPRNLSNKNVSVKINHAYAKIIGRICMDQCMIDITNIKNAKVGDVATIIDSEDNNISLEKLATKADTITDELASRLGNRLKRIAIE